MRVGIMQPYFLPYIGYYQLVSAVDAFVVYDNIKYTKKGWINRNRFLRNNSDAVFSLPIANASDTLDVRDRHISSVFNSKKFVAQISGAYGRAPHREATIRFLEDIVQHDGANLFDFILNSIKLSCRYLGIETRLIVSSTLDIDPQLKSEDRVLAICEALGAETYINPIGGTELYSRETFRDRGISLQFHRVRTFEYQQFGAPFIPWLSILDVLMFNTREEISQNLIPAYELV